MLPEGPVSPNGCQGRGRGPGSVILAWIQVSSGFSLSVDEQMGGNLATQYSGSCSGRRGIQTPLFLCLFKGSVL